MSASIRSLRNGGTPVVNASREDLRPGDVIALESVNPASTYLWNLVYSPTAADGTPSSATLSSQTSSTTEFIVDNEGAYLIRLVVDQGQPTESTQFVRLRYRTDFAGLRLVAAGERRDSAGVVPVDASPVGWANDQNTNILKLKEFVSRVSSSGRVLYVDANRGRDYSQFPENPNVAAGFGDFASIGSAINAALNSPNTPSTDQPWIVVVRPGLYVENVTFRPWVFVVSDHVLGSGDEEHHPSSRSVIVRGQHVAESPSPESLVSISGLYLENVDNTAASFALRTEGPGRVFLQGCQVIQSADSSDVWSAMVATDSSKVTLVDSVVSAYTPSAPLNPALTVNSESRVRFRGGEVFGQNGVAATEGCRVYLDKTKLTGIGTDPGAFAAVSFGAEVMEFNSSVVDLPNSSNVPVRVNPGSLSIASDVSLRILYSTVGGVLFNTVGITGDTALETASSEIGTMTVLPSPASLTSGRIDALTSAATLRYDNTIVPGNPITAQDVQGAIDELSAGVGPSFDKYQNGLVVDVLDAGDSFTIPVNNQYIVFGSFTQEPGSSLVVDGQLVIL